jgi:hypothetical protein
MKPSHFILWLQNEVPSITPVQAYRISQLAEDRKSRIRYCGDYTDVATTRTKAGCLLDRGLQ